MVRDYLIIQTKVNMEGKFKPLGDRVQVRPESLGETKSKGGIILTDSAQRGQKVLGEVVEVGEDVQNIKVGDRVVSHSNLACRVCEMCTSGREFDCAKRQVWGFQTGPLWGAYSELVHLPEVNISKIPEGVSYEDAAAASMTILTSWHMLVV